MTTPSEQLTQKLVATMYLVGAQPMPDALVAEMVRLLLRFPLEWVLGALTKCVLELKTSRLSIIDITSRFEDGRPGPELAWSMVSAIDSNSNEAIVWTDAEMNVAWGHARGLIDMGEIVQARMAFIESYKRLVAEAREAARPPRWILCPGSQSSLESVIPEALRLGRITRQYAGKMLAHLAPEEVEALLTTGARPRLVYDGEPLVDQLALTLTRKAG